MDIALSAFAGGEIEFQVGIGACCIADVVECGSRQRGASEIRVQNNARGIDKRLRSIARIRVAGFDGCGEAAEREVERFLVDYALSDFLPKTCEDDAHRIGDGGWSVSGNEWRQ